MKGGGQDTARLHLAYLEREGVERDGSAGVLYGATDFDRAAFGQPVDGEQRQFRFIVSPEDGADLDLQAFARVLMARMEQDLGRKLIWAGVSHHNTDHPHVHLIVRGLDAQGRQLRIPAAYIQREMRWRAQELATRELGLRTERDLARQQTAEVCEQRFTWLDRRLVQLAREGLITARTLAALPRRDRSVLRGRLETLGRLGLARPTWSGGWRLADDHQAQLGALGERGDIVKRLHRLVPGDADRYRLGRPDELSASFEGVVRGKALHDEQTGQLFAAVESLRGEVHYVPLDGEAASFLQTGDIVRVAPTTEPWVKSTDRSAGVYDPGRHRAELEAAGGTHAASAADLIAGNIRRLERLARYKLVARGQGDTWRIPPTLLADLEARETSHPRRRVRVEYLGADLRTQVTYGGPVWLDRLNIADAGGTRGFAAEAAAACGHRRARLATRGLDPEAPATTAALVAEEIAGLGARLTDQLGLSVVPASAGLKGVLTPMPPLASGRGYARIVDSSSARAVIVPESMTTRRLAGRAVEVVRATADGVDVRPARRLDRGNAK
jgi:type IV secretory pathway VirD2 relaxase